MRVVAERPLKVLIDHITAMFSTFEKKINMSKSNILIERIKNADTYMG
jgi:hypothetical protein